MRETLHKHSLGALYTESSFPSNDVSETNTFIDSYSESCHMKIVMETEIRNKTRFVIDELLSFVPGAFLSAAVSNFTYIGAPSQELCLVMPFVMLPNCLSLSDSLQDITIYMILGLTFCVIYGNILKKIFNQLKSLGSGSTFGYEKVVYWRDISSGMSAIPYFSTKGGVHWAEKYGNVYKCYGLFNEPRVYILDEKNLQKVLVNDAYTKFGRRRKLVEFLKNIIGDGILLVDGDVHKKQRKLMNPLFSNHSVRNMIPTFTKISNTLKDLWKDEIKNSQNVNNDIDKKCAIIDVGHYMGRASLDIMGIVAFDSEINSLTKPSSLADSLSILFDHKYGFAFNLLSVALPIFKLLPLKIKHDTQNASIEIEKITRKL
ncbi:3287_t:CDS:2, partial [Entrophospora sp. SA101]